MKVFKALTFDSLIYGASNFLGKVIGFLLLPLYTSYLTPYDYGIVAMLAFVPIFFGPLASMGITNAIFRRYNLRADKEEQSNILSTGAYAVFFNSLLFLGIGLLFGKPLAKFLVDDTALSQLVEVSIYTAFATSIAAVFTVVLRAERKVVTIGIVRLFELLVTIGSTIYLVVYQDQGVMGVLIGGLVGAVCAMVLIIICCLKYMRFSFDRIELQAMMSYGLPFLPHRLLTFGSTFLGQYLIKTYVGLSATGLCDIALRFAVPLTFIVGSVQSAWVPLKFQIHREEEDASLIFKKVISTYLIFVLAIFLALATFGPELLRLFTAPEFHSAANLLPFVLLIPLARSAYFMLGTGFEFTNNTKPVPLISGAGIIALLASSFPLIRYFGIYGAIGGLVICWIVMTALVRYFARARYYVPLNSKTLWFFILCSVFTTVLCFSFQLIDTTFYRFVMEAIFCFCSLLGILVFLMRSKDFQSLDLERFTIFGMLNRIFILLKR